MSDNPYATPKAPVADIPPSTPAAERPPEVDRAVKLLWIKYGIGIGAVIGSWDYNIRLQSPIAIIAGQCLGFAIALWFYRQILRGRNWARITLPVLLLFSIAIFATKFGSRIFSLLPPLAKASMLLGIPIYLYVLWLLFFSPGRKWFEKVQQ